ncbi:MAG: hypothetical protein B7X95_01400 [Methylophilaceae bacterium 17-44-8]|nr:MAG: hypothetical protein B7X95_01400 [Methylophilaceae bacterium 17-44-8]
MIESCSGIYRIKNLSDNKFYIGSAKNLKLRWFDHRKLLRKNAHFNFHLQRAWNLHGESSFEFECIEFCEFEKLIEREQNYLDKYYHLNVLYNLNPTACSQAGMLHNQDTKLKISTALKGRVVTDEHRLALSISWHKSDKCKKQNEEARKKASLSKLGKKESIETRVKKSIAHTGKKQKPHTEETKRKISETKRNKKNVNLIKGDIYAEPS